jgi:hypothetical protein
MLLALVCGVAGAEDEPEKEKKATFKISVDYMIRGEVRDQADFDSDAEDDESFVGQRTKLKVAGTLADARYVVQVYDGREWGSERTSGSVEQISLLQGYVELGKKYALRIGRQEITWGKKRFIGSTGWGYKNLAAYDGLRLLTDTGSGSWDVFAVKVAEGKTAADDDTNLLGVSYTWKGSDRFKPSLYVLYKSLDNDSSTPEDERISMPMPGTMGIWQIADSLKLDWELAMQTGTHGGIDHSAAYAHVGLRYTVSSERYWFGVAYNYASGDDDPNDDKSKTLDKLYGINHSHYGYIDYQNPQNMRNLRLTAGTKVNPKLSIQLDYHSFELAEASDRWYSRKAAVDLQDPTGAAGSDVGSEIDVVFKIKLPYQLNLDVGLSKYFVGDFVERTLGGQLTDSQWGYVQLKRSF